MPSSIATPLPLSRRLAVAGLGTLTALTALTTLTAAPVTAQPFSSEAFDRYVEGAVSEWGAVGLAVAVVKDGDLVFAEGYGVLELGGGEAVNTQTRFAIGSTTKAMTAAALGMLVDEGRLGWDDPVVDHLPWFRLRDPWVTREVTVRDLLTHRAGLGNADMLWYGRGDADPIEILRSLRHVEPAYSMRSSFIYQNIMYATAGAVIESVSGMSWADFVTTRIFEPLGMDETVARLEGTVGRPNVATPHAEVDGRIVAIENASVDPVDAAGSVWSSVEDMSRWLRMLLARGEAPDGTRLLEEATIDQLFRPQTMVPRNQFYPTAQVTNPSWTTYGLAWFQHDYRGRKLDFHTGSIDGMVAIAGLIRDEALGVYVLGNLDHVEVRHALMYRVLDHFLAPDAVRDWSRELKTLYDEIAQSQAEARAQALADRIEGTRPSLSLEAYAGTYTHPVFGDVTVSLQDGALHVHRGEGLQGSTEHWNYDTFRVAWDARWRGDEWLTFDLAADGAVEGLRTMGLEFGRVEAE